MEAKAKSFTFLGNEGKVRIPFFQRGYVWEKQNWSDLLEDLMDTNRNHFLGSLILKQQKAISGDVKEVMVIDGQQRLTTLSILVKVLYDLFLDELKENTKNLMLNYLFYKKTPTDKNYFLKIQHSHMDTIAYKSVIEGETLHTQLDLITEKNSKILQCYKYFYQSLSGFNENARNGLFNSLLDSENKILVVIDLEDKDNEQAIFDTINSAGVRLSSADIIKNSLFQRALQLYDDQDEVIECYDSSWKKTFLIDEDTSAFWDSSRITGRLMRDNIEILLHCIAVIGGFYNPDMHTLADLGTIYKKKIEGFGSREEIELFIKEICDYAKLYRENIASFSSLTLLSFEDYTSRLLHILDVLQVTTFHPFILNVLKQYKEDEDRKIIFKQIERYLIRRMIVGADTKGYNKICKEFIDDISSLQRKSIDISDEEVMVGLKKIQNKTACLLLFWVELNRRTDNRFDIKELKYNYSLEHIMPQKWDQHWLDIPVKTNSDGSLMTPEEARQDRFEKIYWIGNMTLLTTNSSLKNYIFTVKMNGQGRKKGIKSYAQLSVTKDDIVIPYESGITIWDESRITMRTESIGSEILAIW